MAQRLDIDRKACGMAEDALTVNPGKSLLVDTHKRNPLYSGPKKRPLVTGRQLMFVVFGIGPNDSIP
jgi:hypothetical protein